MKRHWIDIHNTFKTATPEEKNAMVARARGWRLQDASDSPFWVETIEVQPDDQRKTAFTGYYAHGTKSYIPTGYALPYEPISDRTLAGELLTEIGADNEISLSKVKGFWRAMMVLDQYRTVYMYESERWEEAVSGLFVIWRMMGDE